MVSLKNLLPTNADSLTLRECIVVLLSYLVIRTCHRKPEGYIFWILLSCCCMSIKFGRWTRFLKLKKIFWFSRKNYNTSDAAKEVIEEAKWCKWSSKQFLSWLFSQFFFIILCLYMILWNKREFKMKKLLLLMKVL